jgi:tetratricopeptide (TPR) repeat protein
MSQLLETGIGPMESLVGRVADEFIERLGRGEQPDIEEFAGRHPEAAGVLRQVLQALQLVRISGPQAEASGHAQAAESPVTGILGDFRLLREVGRGGMGVVYEAEQISLGRHVALKVLPFASTLDARQLQRFKNEAQAAAGLHHTNIVPVYATGCERGVHFYAMQFIAGHTLAGLIRELRRLEGRETAGETGLAPPPASGPGRPASAGPTMAAATGSYPLAPFVPAYRPGLGVVAPAADTAPRAPLATEYSAGSPAYFRTVVELGIQAAQALEHAHQLGVVHRDIKPGNLLVEGAPGAATPGVRLWVTDFGLAHVQSQAGLTMTGDLVGTLRYMSPEQALAKRVPIDHRTDIYSLGVTLYELLTLEPAFGGQDRQELLRQIAFEEPKPPRRHNKAVPRELETIVGKAMEKNPADRYATAQELADDLERFLKDEPIRARRPSLVQRARKWARRHKAATRAVVCVAAICLLAAGAFWYERHRRLMAVEQKGRESLDAARTFFAANQLTRARKKLAEAEGLIGNDRARLGRLPEEIAALAAELDRFEDFFRLIERAHEAAIPSPPALAGGVNPYPGLPPGPPLIRPAFYNRPKAVPFLRKALSRYGFLEGADLQALQERGLLTQDQVARVRRTAYEELIWLADTAIRRKEDHRSGQHLSPESAARQALAYLAKAERAHHLSVAFYQIRARCRRALKEKAAARKDEEKVRRTAATMALDHYLLGLAAYEAKDKAEGVRRFEAALRLEPTHYWSLMWLGKCLLNLGQQEQDFAAAVAAYSGCILHRPRMVEAWHNRGVAYFRLHQCDKAVADLSKAIELDRKLATAWLDRGTAYSYLRQHRKGVADSSRAIELDPKLALAWSNRGAAYLDLRHYGKAVANSSRAIELDRKLAPAWGVRGEAYGFLKKYDKAIADLSQAIELDPKDLRPWLMRSWFYSKLHRYEEAVADCTRAIELRPKEAFLWDLRGEHYCNSHRYEKAVADHSRAIELDPKYAPAWSNRGYVFFQLHQYERAVADYTKALELDPRAVKTWNNRGLAFRNLHQHERALADYSKAIKLDPKLAPVWLNRGDHYFALGQYETALGDFSKAVELDPKFAPAWMNRGNAYSRLKQYEKALADYSKAIKLDPKLAPAWMNRGVCYSRLKRYEKALTDQSRAIDLAPDWALARSNRGDSHSSLQMYGQAIADYTKAIELDPRDAQTWHGRAVAYSRLHQHNKAIADYSRAIELDGKLWVARAHRGELYNRLGRYREAFADYRKVLEQQPEDPWAMNTLAWHLATCPDRKFRDPKQAVTLAQQAVRLQGKQGNFWKTLGIARHRAGDWKGAVQALTQGQALRGGGDACDWFFLAMAYQQLGKLKEARNGYAKALSWVKKTRPGLRQNPPLAEALRSFQAEAEKVLGLNQRKETRDTKKKN